MVPAICTMDDLQALEQRALDELAGCQSEEALRAWNSRYLGRQGELTLALKKIGSLPASQRPAYGQAVNRLKESLQQAYNRQQSALREQVIARRLASEALDVTLPGRQPSRGRLHPATQMMREILAIFAEMGFQIFHSREVEDDLTNFELLNMPPHTRRATCGIRFTLPDRESSCARTRRRGRSMSCAACVLSRSVWFCQACAIATNRSPPAARSCFSRWKGWRSARGCD